MIALVVRKGLKRLLQHWLVFMIHFAISDSTDQYLAVRHVFSSVVVRFGVEVWGS